MTKEKRNNFVCVVDLEATCWHTRTIPGPDGSGNVEPRSEIIEIGAVMATWPWLDKVGEFQAFVRPVIHPQLSGFCRHLTSIKQSDVDSAEVFAEAATKFFDWVRAFGYDNVVFASWGEFDKRKLFEEYSCRRMEFPFNCEHLNLKRYVTSCLNLGKGKRGLAKVLRVLNIDFEGTQHRGIDDARMALAVLKKAGVRKLEKSDDWKEGVRFGIRRAIKSVIGMKRDEEELLASNKPSGVWAHPALYDSVVERLKEISKEEVWQRDKKQDTTN